MITNPHGDEVPDRTVGEIWLHGNNIGRGYFGGLRRLHGCSATSFRPDLMQNSHADGVADNGLWLATGDLGVYIDGELYLTGRIKDLIVIDGRNHYPTDIETTVNHASPAVRSGLRRGFLGTLVCAAKNW